MKTNRVTVSQITIAELLALNYQIPDYQRSFAWDEPEINRLIKTLLEEDCHFLGNFILHEEGEIKYVVDGQQRLTCLLLAAGKLINLHIPIKQADKDSIGRLQKAKVLIDAQKTALEAINWQAMYVQVTTVYDLDLAFTFFDAQNNAGLPSASKDILKARHLQKMAQNNQGNENQIEMDRLWSEMEDNKDLTQFIHECLYPLRKWIKGESPNFFYQSEQDDREMAIKSQILEEFASDEIMGTEPGSTSYPLPLLISSFNYETGNSYFIYQNLDNQNLDLPIWYGSVGMTIEPGDMFFRYINYYYLLWKKYNKPEFQFKDWIKLGDPSIILMGRISVAASVYLCDFYGSESDRLGKLMPFVYSHLANCRVNQSRIMKIKLIQLSYSELQPINKFFRILHLNRPVESYKVAIKPSENSKPEKGVRLNTYKNWPAK